MLNYSEYYANKRLSGFIKKLWTLDNSAKGCLKEQGDAVYTIEMKK